MLVLVERLLCLASTRHRNAEGFFHIQIRCGLESPRSALPIPASARTTSRQSQLARRKETRRESKNNNQGDAAKPRDAAEKSGDEEKEKKKDEKSVLEVKIDFTDVSLRFCKVPAPPGNYDCRQQKMSLLAQRPYPDKSFRFSGTET